MKISYHAWKEFTDCPKKYFLKYRKKLPFPEPRNDYFTLYGRLTEKFFQMFSNIWRFSMPYMPPEEIRFKLNTIYKGILETSAVDWTAPFITESKDEIFEHAFNDTFAIMESMNQNYFLNTKAEVNITVSTKDADLTGRIDFVHKDAVSQVPMIIDGKGTTEIGKNVDSDQVLYYGLLYFFHYKVVPDQLGFFYYRFNMFKPIPISLNILNEFRAKLSLGVKQIVTSTDFKASPGPKACKYCEYKTLCQEYMEDQAKRKKPSKLNFGDHEGVIEIGL